MQSRKLWSTVLASLALILSVASVLAALSFSAWEPAANLESVPGTSSELNTPYSEGCPILSRNGRLLYFASNRPGGLGGLDIWVAKRDGPNDAFGEPVNLGAPINSAYDDFCPSPVTSGRFFFVSTRPAADACGGPDIYQTRRGPGGWREPVNLGCEVNSPDAEAGPVISFAGHKQVLYFSSTRPGGPLGSNIYMSASTRPFTFGPAELVPGVNSDYDDAQPYVRRDGLEMVFYSTRPGGLGGADIWSASRASRKAEWDAPVNLGPNINSEANETRPSLSWHGHMLLFGSTRPGIEGMADLFYSTRDKE